MNAPFLLYLAATAGLLAAPLYAQDETAHHRAVYSETNKSLATCRLVTATFQDEPVLFELKGWYDDTGTLIKIHASMPQEDGAAWEEYYLEQGVPLFVYMERGVIDENTGKDSKAEDRFYFREGKLIKWIGPNKKVQSTKAERFKFYEKRSLDYSKSFSAALNKSAKTSGNAQSKQDQASKNTRSQEGTFLSIEMGDYAHWQMKTPAGKEVSYFILRPDASVEKVMDKPQAFVGKKCRVTYKTSMEDIPEAGGKMEVEQILSVEWLKK